MSQANDRRGIDKTVADLLDAAAAAAEIVARGRDAWNDDRLLRLAGEAVISRIGVAASKLPDNVRASMPSVPWEEIRANRVLVAHIYHRIDYGILWETLRRTCRDWPLNWELAATKRSPGQDREQSVERDSGRTSAFELAVSPRTTSDDSSWHGSPNGIRTRVSTLRGMYRVCRDRALH